MLPRPPTVPVPWSHVNYQPGNDGRSVTHGFGKLDCLVLAYATTIHTAQGSKYLAMVIALTTRHYPHAGVQPALHWGGPR
jgi:hypothetical protein